MLMIHGEVVGQLVDYRLLLIIQHRLGNPCGPKTNQPTSFQLLRSHFGHFQRFGEEEMRSYRDVLVAGIVLGIQLGDY